LTPSRTSASTRSDHLQPTMFSTISATLGLASADEIFFRSAIIKMNRLVGG
jgi:hypothetical protein